MKSKSAPESAGTPDSEGRTYYANTDTEEWYATVSDRVINSIADWESGEYERGGAVCIGKLTKMQWEIFNERWNVEYKGRYAIGFRTQTSLSPDKRDNLLHRVLLGNYRYLSDSQREILDKAVRIANQVRTAGSGKEEAVAKNSDDKTEVEKKYETFIRTLINQSVRDVVDSKAKKLITKKEIVSNLKKIEGFELPNTDAAILKAIGREPAWKNRRKKLQAALSDKRLGIIYENRKTNDTHRTHRLVQDSWEDF